MQIDLPLVDLFMWGAPESTESQQITSAIDIGPGSVEGTTCEQYAFRQDGLDWQIWIQQGDYPLPRKLILTTTDDDARPRHSNVLTWNLAPSFNDAAFTFDPPKDAQRIAIAEIPASAATGRNRNKEGRSEPIDTKSAFHHALFVPLAGARRCLRNNRKERQRQSNQR